MSELFLVMLALLALLGLPLWCADRKNGVVALALVSVVAMGMYAVSGSPRVVPLVTEYRRDMAALDATIAASSAMLAANPKNLEAWLTLSQALMDTGDFTAAAEGFKQAVLLSHGHPRIIMGYAEAQVLAAEGQVTDSAKRSIEAALIIDKTMPLARYYNALWLLQNGRQPDAMAEMKKLYNELPDSDPLKQRMKEQIGRK